MLNTPKPVSVPKLLAPDLVDSNLSRTVTICHTRHTMTAAVIGSIFAPTHDFNVDVTVDVVTLDVDGDAIVPGVVSASCGETDRLARLRSRLVVLLFVSSVRNVRCVVGADLADLGVEDDDSSTASRARPMQKHLRSSIESLMLSRTYKRESRRNHRRTTPRANPSDRVASRSEDLLCSKSFRYFLASSSASSHDILAAVRRYSVSELVSPVMAAMCTCSGAPF